MVHVSKKDKSLIFLILSVLVVLYGLWSAFGYFISASTFKHSDINKIFSEDKKDQNEQWLNLSRSLEVSDLKDRIVLLNFWSHDCAKCNQTLQEIKKLEQQFGSKITVISIYSNRSETEKNLSQIKKSIIRNEITNPVVTDFALRISNSFKIKNLPTIILIDLRGNVQKKYESESEIIAAKADVKKLVSKFKYELNRDPLPILLEKNNIDGNVLSFPTKIEYAADFSYKGRQIPVLFIANTSKNNIIVTSLLGDIILKIGSGNSELQDGSFDIAAFKNPRGLLYRAGKLYVADTRNNALREIDFKSGKVITLIGSGQKGAAIAYGDEVQDAKSFDLDSPTDIKFFPNNENIAIANSGSSQILNYNLKKETISVLAGEGVEGIVDGKYPNNRLSQTSDMSVYNKKLYFVDSATNSLRFLSESGEVKTLIGKKGSEDLLKYPMGLLVDDTGAYISDSFNHLIKKYDFASANISNISGGKKSGEALGAYSAYSQPEGIVSVLNNFYIIDSNNNRVVILNRGSFHSSLLNVMPPLKLPKEGLLQYLPNLQKSADLAVKSDSELTLKVDLAKGWKINEMGPSFINLLELVKDDQANLINIFDWREIRDKELKLPALKANKKYVLQGVIYYCEDKANSLCYIKSYEQRLNVNSNEKNNQISVKIAY